MTITAGPCHIDGGTLVVFTGTADRSVEWALTGAGTLTPLSSYTNHNGQAAARYTPGVVNATVTITVTHGA